MQKNAHTLLNIPANTNRIAQKHLKSLLLDQVEAKTTPHPRLDQLTAL
jgi:hypothetical protein